MYRLFLVCFLILNNYNYCRFKLDNSPRTRPHARKFFFILCLNNAFGQYNHSFLVNCKRWSLDKLIEITLLCFRSFWSKSRIVWCAARTLFRNFCANGVITSIGSSGGRAIHDVGRSTSRASIAMFGITPPLYYVASFCKPPTGLESVKASPRGYHTWML